MAEAVFRKLASDRGVLDQFRIESRGTGAWHVGDGADPRMVALGQTHAVDLTGHVVRQVSPQDLRDFDVVLAMDRHNLRDLQSLGVARGREIVLMRAYDTEDTEPDVPDPYRDGPEGFEHVYQILLRSCGSLLDDLLKGE
ncbi:MAG: low molecular weight phosphotyrosine protein phosphatase [Deltaproteobacteria bacterium]|nr:low molecular weight phosphotyrosine protein phosphatase [Deltaproteobacteria bacterium]